MKLILAALVSVCVVFLLGIFPPAASADGGIILMGGVISSQGWTPFNPTTPITVVSVNPMDLIVTVYNTSTPGARFFVTVYGMDTWRVEVTGAADSSLQFNPVDPLGWGLWCLDGQFSLTAGEPVDMAIRTNTPPPSPSNPWGLIVQAQGVNDREWQTRQIVVQNRFWHSYLSVIR